MKLSEVPTPALCIDVAAMMRNIERMALYFRDRPTALRPHFKAHKTPAIAKLQAAAGCDGFTCATVGEAEVLVANGFADILIANEILDPTKVDRLRALAESALVIVAIDSLEGVALLKDVPIGAVVDVNVGMPRCGVEPAGASEIAHAILDTELHLRGVMAYEGHAMVIADRENRERTAREAVAKLLSVVERLREEGFEIGVVSAGGTGTYDITGDTPGVTEIQAGSYVLMDTAYAQYGLPFEEALRCLGTVLSVHGRIAVLDAGLKTLATDHGNPELQDGAGARVLYLADEHTTLAVDDGFSARPGDRMWLRPSHVDPTMNLHDHVYAVRGEEVVDVWAVQGRGYRT